MYIGTDIVKISRIESLIKDEVPNRIFTPKEKDYINSKKQRAQTAAGIFAAKEATLKCLGEGISLPLTDICIGHNMTSKPFVELSGKVFNCASKLGITHIEISISHDGEYAIAVAAAQTDEYFRLYKDALSKLGDAKDSAITPEDIYPLLPKRKSQSHKGDYGRLFVLAGSKGLTGAAIMACRSALKCGAGLITLGCPDELNDIFETALPEVMTKPLSSENGTINTCDTDKITESVNRADTILIGPGLSRNQDITDIVSSIIANASAPCIVDADGIYAISQNLSVLKNRKCPLVLTPHIKEFSYLTGLSTDEILENSEEIATNFAKAHNLTLVLKSHKTIICTGDGNIYRNMLGNPGMATGGSGDVLAGCIASFCAQGKGLGDAAKLGVYIHSLSADMAALKLGEYSLSPSDMIDFLPYAIKYSEEM